MARAAVVPINPLAITSMCYQVSCDDTVEGCGLVVKRNALLLTAVPPEVLRYFVSALL